MLGSNVLHSAVLQNARRLGEWIARITQWRICFKHNTCNQKAIIASPPSVTHPQLWAELHYEQRSTCLTFPIRLDVFYVSVCQIVHKKLV